MNYLLWWLFDDYWWYNNEEVNKCLDLDYCIIYYYNNLLNYRSYYYNILDILLLFNYLLLFI